jgi:hypothetical protein
MAGGAGGVSSQPQGMLVGRDGWSALERNARHGPELLQCVGMQRRRPGSDASWPHHGRSPSRMSASPADATTAR